jgi:hypothetical protein
VSLIRMLRVPTPLPNICVQNLRHKGLSEPGNIIHENIFLKFIIIIYLLK